jgi:hypothetical protein
VIHVAAKRVEGEDAVEAGQLGGEEGVDVEDGQGVHARRVGAEGQFLRLALLELDPLAGHAMAHVAAVRGAAEPGCDVGRRLASARSRRA